MKNEPLQSLVTRLKACPARQTCVSREQFVAGWDELRREDVTPLAKPTIPIMAALLHTQNGFAQLLNETERLQLQALIQQALDCYEQQTNPPNKLGKLIAGSIK